MLFSVQRQKAGGRRKGCVVEDVVEFEVQPTYLSPERQVESANSYSSPWKLGPADVNFAKGRRPNVLELLVALPCRLDVARLAQAVRAAVASFPCVAGRRAEGATIIGDGDGLRFSAVRVPAEFLSAHPPAEQIFDPPELVQAASGELSSEETLPIFSAELMTLRLATVHDGDRSALGLCFDHALCDMGGAGLFLAHLSAHYSGSTSPPAPCHDRELQACIIPQASEEAKKQQGAAEPGKQADFRISSRWKRVGGGCVCVEWGYSAAQLQEMKAAFSARSRHDAVFADVLRLLHDAGHQPLGRVSMSKDLRGGDAGLPAEHFGNGAVHIEACLPALPADGAAVAAALRAAVDGQAAPSDGRARSQADAHLNTWWHALQRPVAFGCDADLVSFAIGPGALGAAAGWCAMNGGQPTVTVLPAAQGALALSLLAPLGLAQGVLKLLKQRTKEAKIICRPCPPPSAPERAAAAGVDGAGQPRPAGSKSGQPVFNPEGTSAVIWLHGLGDAGDSWEGRLRKGQLAARSSHLRLCFPKAPMRYIAAHSAERPAWFDVDSMPVTASEPEEPPGIWESVRKVHALLDDLASQGVALEHVLLGGFSQGGAISILAGLSYARRLGGIVSISGWCAVRGALSSSVSAANADVPVFFSCGTADTAVDFALSRCSGQLLESILAEKCVVIHTQRSSHFPKAPELDAAVGFMLEHLPAVEETL